MSQQAGTDTSVSAAGKGLRPSSLGLVSSIVLGISATAPAYSVAASVGFIVLAVGTSAPAMLLVAFVPMMCVAVAFAQLNRIDPDCGTAFTWAARAFGPRTGWVGGWPTWPVWPPPTFSYWSVPTAWRRRRARPRPPGSP
jgi:amino acid transporter